MRILYGVAGEGLGHAMRTQAVAQHLLAQGHDVRVLAAGRAAEALAPHLPFVRRIEGMELAIAGNKVDRTGTFVHNISRALGNVRHNFTAWQDLLLEPAALTVEQPLQRAVNGFLPMPPAKPPLQLVAESMTSAGNFAPDLVISDFESWTWCCARMHGLPFLAIDNCQSINRLAHPKSVRAGQRASFELARAVVKAKSPGADHYIVTTFFKTEVIKKRTTMVPPILRAAALRAIPREGEHVVVYQSAEGWRDLPHVLKRIPNVDFHIYGYRRDIDGDVRDDNLLFRPISEQGFLNDLASCRAVIASAGFTLMSEALWLGKPMLAVPLAGQFEQMLNARWLDHLGYGMMTEELGRKEILRLLDRGDACRAKMRRHRQHGNAEAFEVIDAQVERLTG